MATGRGRLANGRARLGLCMQIDLIERDAAPDQVRRIYDGLEHAGRPVGNLHKALAHKPAVLRTYLQLSSAVMAEGALPLRLKELAYLRASILNGCAY
jgi:alkylhydroperoxidase family enzyme